MREGLSIVTELIITRSDHGYSLWENAPLRRLRAHPEIHLVASADDKDYLLALAAQLGATVTELEIRL